MAALPPAQAQPVQPLVPSAAAAMDWAEFNHPTLFPPRPRNQTLAPYLYRHYATGNDIGVAGTGIWLRGPVVASPEQPVYFGELDSLACAVYPASCSTASDYPARPLTLLVPYAAGGPSDVLARGLAAALAPELGQAVQVRNSAGRDGTTGTAEAAAAAPDGHTLLMHTVALASTATSYRNLPYAVPGAFHFVGLVAEYPLVLVGRPGLPHDTLASLLQGLRAQPSQWRLGHGGAGSTAWLCAALISQQLGIRFNLQATGSTALTLNALMTGATDLGCIEGHSVASYVASGQLRAYAVTSAQRSTSPALASLPTLAESVAPAVVLTSWVGLAVPAGTPAVVRERLNAALRQAAARTLVQPQQQGLAPQPVDDNRASAAGHARFVDEEASSLGAALRAAGGYVE